jgi:opacity protein-like surface antigen
MGMRPYFGLALAAFFACATYSAFAQAVPPATERKSPWAIGAGISGYNPDYGHGHLLGGTLWIDYTLTKVPSLLQGLALEVEARDLNYDKTAPNESALRQDTAGGGVIYSWRHFVKFRPYAKLLAEYGNTDYGEEKGKRGHDSRSFLGGGGGVEYRIMPHLWVRADYEYQSWPNFFKATVPAGRLNPQGFTVGAVYHFSRPRFH